MTNTAEVKKVASCRGCLHKDMCWMLKDISDVMYRGTRFEPGAFKSVQDALGSHCKNRYAPDEEPKFQIPKWLACEHLNTYGRNDTMEEVCSGCGATRPLNRGMPWEAPRQK